MPPPQPINFPVAARPPPTVPLVPLPQAPSTIVTAATTSAPTTSVQTAVTSGPIPSVVLQTGPPVQATTSVPTTTTAPTTITVPTTSVPTTTSVPGLPKQIDVNNLQPKEIWLKLINNHLDIHYFEAVNRLLDCDFDPFTSNPPRLLFSCLETFVNNPSTSFDNLPPRFLLYIDYFDRLKQLYTTQVSSYFK